MNFQKELNLPSNSPDRFKSERVPTSRSRNFNVERHFKRTTDTKNKNFHKLKTQGIDILCYISPQKDLEKTLGNQEKRISFEAICGSPRAKVPQDDICGLQKSTQNEAKLPLNVSNQKTELKEENEKLMCRNVQLQKQLVQQSQKIKRLQSENNYCFLKIQQLSILMDEKNEQISSLNNQLKDHQKLIDNLQKVKEAQESFVNKINQQTNSIISISEETDDGDKSIFQFTQADGQLWEYKRIIRQLHEKLKYLEIHEYLYKKLKVDYEQQEGRNKKLDLENQKLKRKLQRKNSKPCRRENQRFIFELSPEK